MLMSIAIGCIALGSLGAYVIKERKRDKTYEQNTRVFGQTRLAIIEPYEQEINAAFEAHRISKNVIFSETLENLALICSNGHRFARKDMTHEPIAAISSNPGTRIAPPAVQNAPQPAAADTQSDPLFPDRHAGRANHSTQEAGIPNAQRQASPGTDFREGCPICHSTVFVYESDQGLQHRLNLCTFHEHKPAYSSDQTKRLRMYLTVGTSCPFCAIDASYSFRIKAIGAYPTR